MCLASLCRGWARPYKGMLKVPSQATTLGAGEAMIHVSSDILVYGASLIYAG